ncbi:MAG TPA: HAMP domain-containing sensor histidine kinase [Steroidobacteraceae bacterium]
MDESMGKVEPLAVLAHELRNPIGAIRNAVVLMESAGQLPGAMDQARRLISRQAGQLSVLVEDLLDLASFSRGTLTLRREWIDIVREVEAAVESCSWALLGSGHTLCVDVPATPLYACADGARLRQVVTNLLDNACKYTPAFGRIRLSLEPSEDSAVLIVEDNGVGIASESLPYVFDLFVRSYIGRESSPRGLGVGLALVREIAELHGGKVQARSAGIGHGSAFVVSLPVCPSSLMVRES